MGSLGLTADPDGWLNAGYTINALMDSLENELDDADRIGGSGLRQSWAGPVAEAFMGHWGALRPRVEDLIDEGRRAAGAITNFGGKLEDFVKRAADLERYWLGFGLQLEGALFTLPLGFEFLSPEHQLSFRQLVAESVRDVNAMWDDIRAAVDDVVTVLESLIAAFEDFEVLGLGALAGLFGGYLDGYLKDPVGLVSDGLSVLSYDTGRTATYALDHAYETVVATGEDTSRGMRAAADAITGDALRAATMAGKFDRVAEIGAKVSFVVAAVGLAWQIRGSIRKDGVVGGIEDHAGDIASLALTSVEASVGLAVAAALLPEAAVGVGAVVVAGVVAVGVSYGVQWVVDHNKTTINHAISDIGHGAEVTATAVGHKAEAVGHGLGNAADWGVRQAEDLL